MAVTDSQLRRFWSDIPSTASIVDDLAAARAMMAARLNASGLPATTLHQIELRLAAYFAALRFASSGLTNESIEGVSSLSWDLPKLAENFWASAIRLDPTGALSGASLATARFRVV